MVVGKAAKMSPVEFFEGFKIKVLWGKVKLVAPYNYVVSLKFFK